MRARSRIAAAAVAAAAILLQATPAAAHGIGGRLDLPVPRWLFVFGASTVLVASFVLLGALWREPRLAPQRPDVTWNPLRRAFSIPAVEWILRAAAFAAFLVVLSASLLPRSVTQTIGPVVVLIWFWVGLAFLQILAGDWWATLSPFDTIGRVLRLDPVDGRAPRTYPERWGLWPAAIGLLGFTWIELVDPLAGRPGSLGLLMLLYTLVQVVGMTLFGRATWLSSAEAFAVHLGLLARIAPVARDRGGRIRLRAPFVGLADVGPRTGLAAVVIVGLGTTTFDGITRTRWWFDLSAGVTGAAGTLLGTAGLVGTVLAVGAVYLVTMRVAALRGGRGTVELAERFAPTLVPIVAAYLVAHYVSYLFIEGQLGVIRLSDPFGLGWDLFGTADRAIDLSVISPTTVWYVQVASIVIGHVASVVLSHDLALRIFEPRDAVRTQYALLAAMVGFTAIGLVLLSGG